MADGIRLQLAYQSRGGEHGGRYDDKMGLVVKLVIATFIGEPMLRRSADA